MLHCSTCSRGRFVYHQSTWVQWACWHILAAIILVPLVGWWSSSVDLLPPLLLCLSTGMILNMHFHLEQVLNESRPLPAKFLTSTRRLFLSPFISLWIFLFLLTLRVVNTVLIPYTILFAVSYIFSISFSLWLYAIKPAHGLCCAIISLPWVIFEVTLGLKLDGILKGLPWILVFFSLYICVMAVLAWHHILPYLWEENLPQLSTIYQVNCLKAPSPPPPEQKNDELQEDISGRETTAPLIEESINGPVDLPPLPPAPQTTALDSQKLKNEDSSNSSSSVDGEAAPKAEGTDGDAERKGEGKDNRDSEFQEKD